VLKRRAERFAVYPTPRKWSQNDVFASDAARRRSYLSGSSARSLHPQQLRGGTPPSSARPSESTQSLAVYQSSFHIARRRARARTALKQVLARCFRESSSFIALICGCSQRPAALNSSSTTPVVLLEQAHPTIPCSRPPTADRERRRRARRAAHAPVARPKIPNALPKTSAANAANTDVRLHAENPDTIAGVDARSRRPPCAKRARRSSISS